MIYIQIIFRIIKFTYLLDLIPKLNRVQNVRRINNIPPTNVRHDYFESSIFPYTVLAWNKSDLRIRNSVSQFSQFNRQKHQNARFLIKMSFNKTKS